MYFFQHCFSCRLSDSTVSEDDEIEPRTVATLPLAIRRSNHLARSHPQALGYISSTVMRDTYSVMTVSSLTTQNVPASMQRSIERCRGIEIIKIVF
jgi:hypothetical protein